MRSHDELSLGHARFKKGLESVQKERENRPLKNMDTVKKNMDTELGID